MAAALLSPLAHAEWHYETAEKMGTLITVQFWHEDAQTAAALMQQSMAEFDRIENAMSTYIEGTEMWRVNEQAGEQSVVVSAELFNLIKRSIELSELTGGVFDITYDSVGVHYDFRNNERPDEEVITGNLAAIDYRALELNEEELSIRFTKPGMRINLGGIAKGYSVEQVVALLRKNGVVSASATAGGDSRILGDRLGEPWIIGIRHPDKEDAVVTRLPVIDEAVSTSGDYERFFIEDGQRYHHILDPQSGLPTEGVRSVTILGPDGTMTDGLSTSLFVAGVTEGLKIIEKLPAYEAVIIDSNGTMHYSSGLLAQ